MIHISVEPSNFEHVVVLGWALPQTGVTATFDSVSLEVSCAIF